jgi:branched-chain amino acid aminotransferase
LYIADEAFFCGTGAQIKPISSVDHRTLGDGKPGPITTAIADLYFRIVYGKESGYSDWLTPVYAR